MAEEKYRLKARLPNGAEFEAEGPEQVVQAFFARFLEALNPSNPNQDRHVTDTDEGKAVSEEAHVEAVLTPAQSKVFARDRAGEISVTALPRGNNRDSETLLLLLYGYLMLKGQHSVTGTTLKKAARQSGIQLERVDRLLAPQEAFINVAGFKKGRRYGLNNQGIRKAEELIEQIMG